MNSEKKETPRTDASVKAFHDYWNSQDMSKAFEEKTCRAIMEKSQPDRCPHCFGKGKLTRQQSKKRFKQPKGVIVRRSDFIPDNLPKGTE